MLPALALLLACHGAPFDTGSDTSANPDSGLPDGDSDGLPDAQEAAHGCDPSDADSDDDGLLDGEEVAAGADCADPDSDADGLCDGTRRDDDGDGTVDPASPCVLSEGWFGCDPLAADGDGGGTPDRVEALRDGTDCTDGSDDEPVCTPNLGWETWEGGTAPGFTADAGVTVHRSSSALVGQYAAELIWSGTDPQYVALAQPLPTADQPDSSCMFRAWVDDTDPNVQVRAGNRHGHTGSDGTWVVDSTAWGPDSSGDGGWQELAQTFSCASGPVQPVLELRSFSGAQGRVHTDEWMVHSVDQSFPTVADAQTDTGARQLSGPSGPVALYALLRSASTTEGTLYVSAPWAHPDTDRAVFVWGGGTDPTDTVPAPWSKRGTVPAARGRLFALLQEGSNPTNNLWDCGWYEWAPSGTAEWVQLGTSCSGGFDADAKDRLEGLLDMIGSIDTGWPATFSLAVTGWQTGDGGALLPAQQIPAGNGDSTLDADEVIGPLERDALFGSVAVPCAGVGDPSACQAQVPGPASTCSGDLLQDGGFESGTYTSGLPSGTGAWGGDYATIDGYGDCLAPLEGRKWLHLRGTAPLGASADDRAEAIQLVDVSDRHGQDLDLSAAVARTLVGQQIDTFFGVEAWYYDGTPSEFPLAWTRGQGTVLARLPGPTREVAGAPEATAHPSGTVHVPDGSGDAYLAVVIFALEDVANDTTGAELAGHYVDDVCLAPAAR